ncbi:MAG: hypothetical protein ACI3XI_03290 [Eubacteriales bacterium]
MALNLLVSYPVWTLLCALFFPMLATIATFVCLRRANTSRRYVGFFVIIPIFVALIVVFLSDTGSIMTDLLASVGLYYPPVVGFMAAITLGIFCLDLIALVCGVGLLKPRGAVTNAIATVIALGAEIFVLYSAWSCRLRFEDAVNDGFVINIGESLPFFSFLPDVIQKSGVELVSLAILSLYLIVYFLSFIALRSPEQIMKEDLERRRRAALLNSPNSPSAKRHSAPEEEELPGVCAYCERATVLKGDRTHMVCDCFGVVSSCHTCRKFLYDPLKRTATRPRITPTEEEEAPPLDLDHI